MAFTKITGYGISESTDIHVGMVTIRLTVFKVSVFSGGTAIHSGIIDITELIGTSGNTFAVAGGKVDISIAGGAGGAVVPRTDNHISMRMTSPLLRVTQYRTERMQ